MSDDVKLIMELVKKIAPLLHGHGPQVQSAILADLTAMWLAGHHPSVRADARRVFDELVDDLLVENVKAIWGK